MNLTIKQKETIDKIKAIAPVIGLDTSWCLAVAMEESSLGERQLSPTGCRGIFQMSSIAMKELYRLMKDSKNDWIDVLCGLAFMMALKDQWGSIEEATAHFCDPNDRGFYIDKVKEYMKVFSVSQKLISRDTN